jgi:HSP20 family molecular chaperone IbpA
MSAKWRRTKKHSGRFDILRSSNKPKNQSIHNAFKIKSAWVKKQSRLLAYETPGTSKQRKCREPEPLIDILEENDEITIVAEFAGFKKRNIRIHVNKQRLTLAGEAAERKYYKSLNLPKRVIPNTIRTKYKNGVLEIRLKKYEEEKTVDKVAG